MRISDWSSDVCSSDLGEGDRGRRKERFMALTAHPPTQDLINLVGTLGGTWHGRTAMCLCPAHADKNPSLALRSEEHTSELQSLMRISYAVFCLKKKKKTSIYQIYSTYQHLYTDITHV